ncbi:MAG: cation transporter [Clostridia bacterium]|nr:cation transporter [Clostridia bacterium]
MKSEKKILTAFILNFAFSVFEFFGGIFTGSVAILSDALHDVGDAASIGISYFLEKKSKKQPDEKYTYGYGRYSVLGGVITTVILLFGSVAVIVGAVKRIISPTEINYNGMIVFAVVGAVTNFLAAYFTHGGHSVNQKAVNLHMLEDVLGWIVVLIGALVMRFTDFRIIDPLMSISVAVFIFINAAKNLKEIADIFLEKTPEGANIAELKEHITGVEGVIDVHHIHLWSMNGENTYGTMHIVAQGDFHKIKEKVREELKEHGIVHATLETETPDEHCHEESCSVREEHGHTSHHHHHH